VLVALSEARAHDSTLEIRGANLPIIFVSGSCERLTAFTLAELLFAQPRCLSRGRSL